MPAKPPKAERYLEVERKFEVPEPSASPIFDGIRAVVGVKTSPPQSLDAVYFDTPGRDLTANRITLRRRTGGPDAGWHLKLPAGPDARTEIRAPLTEADNRSRDDIPAELLDVVLAIVRDRPMAPVARISTTRTVQLICGHEGVVLAEFCDDQVTTWSAGTRDTNPAEQHWHEWELELRPEASANIKLLNQLSKRLRTAGAVPAGYASKLARALGTSSADDSSARPADPLHRAVAEQIDELLIWDRGVRADVDDAVHQMRVTIRTIRSLLQAAQDSFGLPDIAEILDELQELGGVLGTARDAEVLGERYRQALEQLTPELVRGPVRERLVDGAQHRYQSGLRRSLTAMRSVRYFRLLDALDALVAEAEPTTPGPHTAPVTINAAYKRVRKAAEAASHTDDGEQRNLALHRIRKRAKRLRYTAAAVGAKTVSDEAKAIQTLLGDHQDSVVSRTHLIEQAEAAHGAGEDTFTYGLLYQQGADLAWRCQEQLAAALGNLRTAVRENRG